jgi:hypothetical protein
MSPSVRSRQVLFPLTGTVCQLLGTRSASILQVRHIVLNSVADSGSRGFFTPGSGIEKIQSQDPGSGMNIQDFIFENLVSVFWVKNTFSKFFDAKSDPGFGILSTLDPGWKKIGSGINVLDPQHWFLRSKITQDRVDSIYEYVRIYKI